MRCACSCRPGAKATAGRVGGGGKGTPDGGRARTDNAATELISAGENGLIASSASPRDLAAAIVEIHAGGARRSRSRPSPGFGATQRGSPSHPRSRLSSRPTDTSPWTPVAKPDLTGASEQEAEVLEGEILESPEAGAMVIRGGLLRAAGYGAGILITAAASVLLLRYLGVVELGRYATVVSLIGIVSGVTDAGITTVGARDLARLPTAEQRRHLLSNLVGLRLVLTPIGVLAAVLFTALAGFDEVLVLGTLVAGFGLVLLNVQVTMTLLLSVDLKVGRLAVVDVIRQAVALAGIAVLVAAGASLLPFFSVYILAGIVLLALTPLLVGPNMAWRPAFDRETQRHLIREALPLAAAIVMNVLYFRILVILMSLIASGFATGLFATSFRIFEILFLIPSLVLAVALPVVSVAAETVRGFATSFSACSKPGWWPPSTSY